MAYDWRSKVRPTTLLLAGLALGGSASYASATNFKVYVSNEAGNNIAVFDQAHEFLYSIADVPPSSPRMLQVAPNGHLYVASYGRGQVLDFDQYDSYLGSFGTDPDATGLAVGLDNRIYVSVRTGSIYSPSGGVLGTFGADAAAMDISTNGYLLCANNTLSTLEIRDLDGNLVRDWYTGGKPRGIAAGPDGYIYLSRGTANDIQVYDYVGSLVRTISGSGLDGPYGISFSPNGTLYVANYGAGNVLELSTTGDPLSVIGTNLGGPVDVGFRACHDDDADGYLAEPACGSVQDCNDASSTTYPGAVELCDGYDNNCDGLIDEPVSCATTCDNPDVLPRSDLAAEHPDDDYSFPRLAWNPGTGYGMVWWGYEQGQLGPSYFRTLDDNGTAPSAAQLVPGGSYFGASIVWSGSGYGVAAGDVVRLFDTTGQPSVPPLVFSGLTEPSIVWNGRAYALVGLGCGGICFYEVRPSGDVTNSKTVFPGTWQDVELVWNPRNTEYGVLLGGSGQIYFARLDRTGEPISAPSSIAPAQTYFGSQPLQMLWNGTGYTLLWGFSADSTRFLRLLSDGSPVGGQVPLLSGFNYYARLAWTGSEYGVVWTGDGLQFARLDSAGTRGPSIAIDPAGAYPDISWNGFEFLVAYGSQGGMGPIKTRAVACHCVDSDDDQYSNCIDCDDSDPYINPGAPEVCNGVDDNCDQQVDEGFDDDDDGITTCNGDCSDGDPSIYPHAPQLCDGKNNDCLDPTWPTPPADEANADGDAFRVCDGDCNDFDTSVYPGAPQLCDGTNNDCLDPTWPSTPEYEADADSDGFRICAGDCDDQRQSVNPGAVEVCDGIDDNCNGKIDEDAQGLDSDADGIHNACDNCRFAYNPSQLDTDGDGLGSACDNCVSVPNPDQADLDSDARGNVCDNCVDAYNPFQDDSEGDRVGDACDNCFFDYNPGQSDFDSDLEGDVCDFNDGLILQFRTDPNYIEWQEEQGPTSWNVYEGDLDVLKATGVYTQLPGSNPLADRHCGEPYTWVDDFDDPPARRVAFSLVTGVQGGVEGSLGQDSAGNERPNANPCP